MAGLRRFDGQVDTEEALGALEADGAIIIEGLESRDSMEAACRELSPWLDVPAANSPLERNFFTGYFTVRTSALIAKSEVCGRLALNSPVNAILDRVLGPQCACYQLSFTQAIKILPGEKRQLAHRDTGMYPFARPGPECFVNTLWAGTEFTEENGGTVLYPGSHHWDDERKPTDSDPHVAAEMSPGSVLIYLGSVWHGGGANRADSPRVALGLGYTLGWLRQEENQYLAVPPDVARRLPVELQRLIGYSEHFPFLGWTEGQDVALVRGKMRSTHATALRGRASSPGVALRSAPD